jgi:hypothetical protein
MGETLDQSALKDVPSGGYFVANAETRHFFAVVPRSARSWLELPVMQLVW